MRLRAWCLSGGIGAVLCLAPHIARADKGGLDQPAARTDFGSPQNFAVEVRVSLYRPEVDSDPKLTGKPFADTFGTMSRVAVGLEFDWQFLRVPKVFSLGLGASIAHTSISAPAKLAKPLNDQIYSAEETSLSITPMYAVAVGRLDLLAKRLRIPVVPYGKIGLGMALWTASNESGTSKVNGREGKGISYGLHYAAGLMLHLNPFEPSAALELDNSLGINHSYLFVEYYASKFDGFGKSDMLRVGSTSWSFGLAFEM